MRVEIDPPEGDHALIPDNRRYIVEMSGIGNVLPDSCSCGYTAKYDEGRRALTLTLDAGVFQGAAICWTNTPTVPAVNWKTRLREMLVPAQIDFDLKGQVMEAARQNDDAASFLAQLHMLKLPFVLYGAILELLSAC